jgi:hypothetical protein
LARNDGPLSASAMNPLIEELRSWAIETREWLLQEFYASGHPLGTEPSTPYEIYERLISLMQGGHPEYWQSQDAQDELRKLEERFGPAPPLQPQPPQQAPMGGVM